MSTMSITLIQRIMRASLCLFLVLLLNSCSKENDFKPDLLDLANSRIKTPATKPLNDKELLGKYIYFDASLSASSNGQFARGGLMTQSCASCHLPQQGYAGFESGSANRGNPQWGLIPFGFESGIGEGAVNGAFGGRKPPSAAYATFSPILDLNAAQINDDYEGGLFWDGRATGSELGNVAAEQARGPFLAGKEHNFNTETGRRDLLLVIKNGSYYPLYKKVYGAGLDGISVSTDPASPMVITHYNNVAFAIAAYEGSSDVNQFSSKYDDVMRKTAKFTPEEAEGYRIIQSSQVDNCGSSGCHKEKENGVALFTDFGYENIGLPWKDAYRSEDGLKRGDVDQGLYATIISNPNKNNLNMAAAREHIGTFKTPTLRNVARGENSNGAGKGKRFMHNGIFRTLEEVIHFYNTRSVPGEGWNTKTNTAAKGEGWRPWGTPEYAATMADNDEVGKLGLSARQEKAIVVFLRTLSDTRDVLPPPPYSGAVTPVQIAN